MEMDSLVKADITSSHCTFSVFLGVCALLCLCGSWGKKKLHCNTCQSLDLIKNLSLLEYRLHFCEYNGAVTDD